MNIMILDDEPIIANTVFLKLQEQNQEGDSYSIAFSTRDARKQMEKTRFDIFLCDIVMPVENGIDFARWVLERYPDRKIIFLTAHADFEYMKQAISIRSFDYILQPADTEEIKSAVERAKSQILIERKNRELLQTGAFFHNREEELLGQSALRYLEGYSSDHDCLFRLLRNRSEDFSENDCFHICLVSPVHMGVGQGNEQTEFRIDVIRNVIDEMATCLKGHYIVLEAGAESHDMYILASFSEDHVPDMALLREQYDEMRRMFQKLMDIDAALYVGNFCPVGRLPETFSALKKAAADNVGGVSRLFFSQDRDSNFSEYSLDLQSRSWKMMLDNNHVLRFRNSLLRYVEQISESGSLNQSAMMKIHQAVSAILFNYMSVSGIRLSDVFDEKLTYYDFLYSYRKVDTFRNIVYHLTERVMNHSEGNDETTKQNIIGYIRDHIDQDLTVSEIADGIGMNQDYLGRMFKKRTGQGLKHYIIDEKMKAAKILLRDTELSITDVASQVGYPNYSNFSRVFKQETGITPSEFRSSLLLPE
jgi:two-component system response regulator YesN